MKRFARGALGALAAAYPTPLWLRMRILSVLGIRVGSKAEVRPGFRCLHGHVTLGDEAFLSNGCYFEDHAAISIGSQAWLGAQTRLVTATHDIGTSEKRAGAWRAEPIRIGDGCWLGTGATVLAGVTVGDGCVIGAGTLVLRDCEPNGLYVGVPARRVRDLPVKSEMNVI